MERTQTLQRYCPHCGYEMIVEVYEQTITEWTGDYFDEDEREYVTRTASGFIAECQNPECGYLDGEPPQF